MVVTFSQIRDAIAAMCRRANFGLTADRRAASQAGMERETLPRAKNTLRRILQNAEVVRECRLPMGQDTGLVVMFAEVGQETWIEGGTLRDAVNDAPGGDLYVRVQQEHA